MDERSQADDMDLNELGAMVIEQKRIEAEIKAQQAKLAELKTQPQPGFKDYPGIRHMLFESIHLKFGWNDVDGQKYACKVVKLPPSADAKSNIIHLHDDADDDSGEPPAKKAKISS